jgi:ferredoxin
MGVVHIDEVYAPATLRRLACFLEDNGYEGVVYRAVTDRRPGSNRGTEPERGAVHKLEHAEPVAPGKPAPDVLMDFRLAATICGLGEIGYGGFVLTPEFGPLQRFAFILTDAPLAPDPMPSGTRLCDRCGKCAAACPGQALNLEAPVHNKLAQFAVEHAELDEWQCAAHYQGANRRINPFLAPDKLKSFPDAARLASGDKRLSEAEARKLMAVLGSAYPGVGAMYPASLCGRACYRACLAHLEEQGKLTRTYHAPFRRGPAWSLPA